MLELNFQLNDGREISLKAFLEVKTYAGLLIGKPDASINRGILNSHEKLCHTVWPGEPHVTLGLDYYESHIHENLPAIICAGQFSSCEPVAADGLGSSLIVVWFQEQMFPLLQEQNAPWLKNLAWKEFARDFDW
jgi:hypothetical protein